MQFLFYFVFLRYKLYYFESVTCSPCVKQFFPCCGCQTFVSACGGSWCKLFLWRCCSDFGWVSLARFFVSVLFWSFTLHSIFAFLIKLSYFSTSARRCTPLCVWVSVMVTYLDVSCCTSDIFPPKTILLQSSSVKGSLCDNFVIATWWTASLRYLVTIEPILYNLHWNPFLDYTSVMLHLLLGDIFDPSQDWYQVRYSPSHLWTESQTLVKTLPSVIEQQHIKFWNPWFIDKMKFWAFSRRGKSLWSWQIMIFQLAQFSFC